jgi:replicative DNA helicase
MASKYVDVTAIMQIIGCVFNNPSLLDLTDKYNIVEEDFPSDFHKVAYGAIYKLHELGVKDITLENISDFLSARPKSEAIFKQQKGEEWLLKVADNSLPNSFDYYYMRLKKMTLLRAYDKHGVDVSEIYDPDNILDMKKRQFQEEQLDNMTTEQIADKVDSIIEDIRSQYVDEDLDEAYQAGDGAEALIDKFKEHPEVGVPMYGHTDFWMFFEFIN